MLVRAKMFIAFSLMAFAVAVVSLPVVAHAATSPTVTVLDPLTNGLKTPTKIALDASGNIYVADGRAGGIVKFDMYGNKLLVMPLNALATGLAFAQDGTLIVPLGTSVARLNPATGEEIGRFTGGSLVSSAGVAVNEVTGFVYVADNRSKQIEVYDVSGRYVTAFGNTVLAAPTVVRFEKSSGYLAVCDGPNNKVQFFDVNGNYTYSAAKSFGDPIPGGKTAIYTGTLVPMQFASALSMTFEYSNGPAPVPSRIYVLDAFQGNIQVVDPVTLTALSVAGATTNYIGSLGSLKGQLLTPSDVVFDKANGRLLVANTGVGNITMYGIDGGKSPIYVDTTPPVLTVNPLLATVSVPEITLSGSMESGATVAVTTATAVAGAVSYPSATTWKSYVTALSPGENLFAVTAKDAAGNVTSPLNVNTRYQLPAPVMTVAVLPALTNLATMDVTGTVDSGATVTVANKTTGISGSAVVTGTTWSYRVGLAEGANSISVEAQRPFSDKASAALQTALDSTPPLLNVSALADGSYTSTKVQNVQGTVSDVNTVAVLVNDVPATVIDGGFTASLSLVTGANTVTVVAGDLAGNSATDSRTIYFDPDKPVITITSPMDNSYTNNTGLVKISGSVSETATVTVAGAAADVDSSNNWSANVQLAAGLNDIQVVATDRAGNTSSMKRSVTLDTVNPVLAITTPAQDIAVNQKTFAVSGTVEDGSSITVAYSVNGGAVVSAPVNAGAFSFNVDFVNEGTYPVVVTATDAAGNSTTATRSLIYDATPPVFAIDALPATVSVPNVTLSGTMEAGITIMVATTAPTAAAAVAYPTATTWKTDITGLVPGTNTITVTAKDPAGNTTLPQSASTRYQLAAPALTASAVPAETSAATYDLSGTVETGATVTVTNTTTNTVGSAVVAGANWNYTVVLVEGANSITVEAQKPLSDKAMLSLAIKRITPPVPLDTTPPALVVSGLPDGSYTATQVQNISGSVTDASPVTVTLNALPVTITGGAFSVPVTLAVGANVIKVVARDSAGNETVNTRTIYFDASIPVITVVSPTDNSLTNSADLKVSGTVSEAAKITVAGISATVDASNNWSATVRLAAGLNSLQIVATDLAGNTSSMKRSVTLDAVKPVLAITSPTQDIATKLSSVTITGTVSDSNSLKVTYTLNGATVTVPVSAGKFSFKVSFTKQGAYPVTVTATDAAGNISTATRTIIYDTTPPLLTLNTVTGAAPVSLSGTVEAGATVVVKLGTAVKGKVTVTGTTWTCDMTGVTYTSKQLIVTATDAAGNSTVVSKTLK